MSGITVNRNLSEYEKKAFQDQWDDYKRYGGAVPVIPNAAFQYLQITTQKPKKVRFPVSLITHCQR